MTTTHAVTEETPAPAVRREALHFALRNGKLVAGLVVVVVFLAAAVVGPMTISYGPNDYVGPAMASPSGEYWFGTTTFGQDVFAQFVYGLRSTFLVGVLGGGLAALIGMAVGFTAGYRGGLVDEVLNMLTNIVLVLPALVVLLVANAYLGVRSIGVQALFIGLTSWPWAARAIRAQTFSLRSRDFVDLARLSGVRTPRIIVREIAPNMSSYLFMTFILLFGGAVLVAASLDFIGLGPTQGVSLGLMLNNAARWSALQLGMWWWFVPPGAGITAVVGALYVMNVGLDEVFNPKLREM
ncbi:ABC transporter permease [Microbispora sp. ATCC PTA-5024]|uniref:ABC transporter permease n=1 Tax=Microbispora sp. ATCC PTA-5024 TaxID=316330 RepID=UPI0003DCAB8F|nr:ABC transporter permease [Microbispora sp. ATCC PTA-5024]ETK35132.1 peptide ABC transporter permease [Microbispora sp. ATCC PTA-5024]